MTGDWVSYYQSVVVLLACLLVPCAVGEWRLAYQDKCCAYLRAAAAVCYCYFERVPLRP
jgi:hypothetical protein